LNRGCNYEKPGKYVNANEEEERKKFLNALEGGPPLC
jgi:hypothetical protein